MNLPKDPFMLLSMVNMKLRDSYDSFDSFVEDMDLDGQEILSVLKSAGFTYDEKRNQFT